MKQGEIWDIYLDPVLHSTSDIGARGMQEQGGRRPAVILSGNLLNKYLDQKHCRRYIEVLKDL